VILEHLDARLRAADHAKDGHTTCPTCARYCRENYVVGVAKVSPLGDEGSTPITPLMNWRSDAKK